MNSFTVCWFTDIKLLFRQLSLPTSCKVTYDVILKKSSLFC